MSFSMFLCGILAIVQGFGKSRASTPLAYRVLIAQVRGFGGLVTVRLLLGIAEAGIYPGCRFCQPALAGA